MTDNPALTEQLAHYAEKICREKGWVLGHPLPPGGTSAVYEVSAEGKACALKVSDPSFLAGARGDVTRQRHGLMLEKLKGHSCPHLVAIYDGGEVDDTIFLLMARVPGQRLTDALSTIPRDAIRRIINQLAQAAQFLEGLGLCHRDIKSDNIVISDDYATATLLDLGVIRQIDDSGAGTDSGGQLPFVATAQYSSPDYMFRLVESGPRLWLGLTFYQLGAVLHDLIMRVPIFDDVVRRGRDNRYLIAHAVATRTPSIVADADVPMDLVLVAQRALQKDLDRRLKGVKWEDFCDADGGSNRRRYEILLGLEGEVTTPGANNQRQIKLQKLAESLHTILDGRFVEKAIHARHSKRPVSPDRFQIRYTWTPPALRTGTSTTAVVELYNSDESLQLDIWAEYGNRNSAIWATEKFPAGVVVMPADSSVPQPLVEAALDGILRAFAQVVADPRASASN